MSEIKQIPLNDLHEQLGGKMVPFAGFNMPVRYSSDKEEHETVRNAVGVFDVSHMGEFMVRGPKAIDLIQRISSNDASKIINGQAQYACMPNDTGGIVDDFLVYRFSEEKYMLVVNASNIEKDWKWIERQNTFGAELEDVSDELVLLAVQGPKAIDVLQKLTEVNLSNIKFYHFKVGFLAGVEMVISATGYTGSGGFELYINKEDAKGVWDKIFEAGQDFGIKPIGLGARDTLRLEKGYCLYGNDITDETSPLEAGLGWVTKFTKDFVNANALKAQKEQGVERKLVAFAMEDKGIPRQGYELKDGAGSSIGIVTSGTMSPTLGIGIGLGYVQTTFATVDSEIFVQVRNKTLKAKVVKLPFV